MSPYPDLVTQSIKNNVPKVNETSNSQAMIARYVRIVVEQQVARETFAEAGFSSRMNAANRRKVLDSEDLRRREVIDPWIELGRDAR